MAIVDNLILAMGVTGVDKVKAAKSTVSGFMGVFGKLLGMVGGTIAITKAITGFVDEAVKLQRLSDITGESVENLSAWKQAIEAAGEDGSAFLGTVKGITENVNNLLLSGSGDLHLYLGQLGVGLHDANGQLKDATAILADVADAWDGFSSRDQAMIGKHLGIDEGTIRFLQKGGEEVASLIDKQKQFGVISAEQAESALQVKEAWAELKSVWHTTINLLVAKLMPALSWMLVKLTDVSRWVIANKPVLYGFIAVIGALAALAGVSLAIMGAAWIKAAVISLVAAAKMAAAWVIALGPIAWIVAAIIAYLAAIGTVLYLLYDDFMTWKEGGISAFGEVWEALERIVLAIWDGLRALGAFLLDFWNDPKKKWDEAIAYLQERWEGMSLSEIAMDIIRSFAKSIEDAWDNYVKPLVTAFDNKFRQWFGFSLFGEGDGVITSFISGIMSKISALDKAIQDSVVGPIYKKLKVFVGDAITLASDIVKGMVDTFGEKVTSVVDAFSGGILDGLKAIIKEFNIVTLISEWIEGVRKYFSDSPLYESGQALIDSLWDGIKEVWDKVVAWFEDIGKSIEKLIPTSVLDFMKDAKDLVGGVVDSLGSATDTVSEVAGSVVDSLGSVAGKALDTLGGAWDSFWGTSQPSPATALPSGGTSYSSNASVGTMNVYTQSNSPNAIKGAVAGALVDVNDTNRTAQTADGAVRR